MTNPVIVWFRLDLRLDDNPALLEAAESGRPVIPLYVWQPDEEAPWQPGAASRWWLHHSLNHLAGNLKKSGASLVIRKGGALNELQTLIRETSADAVYWNRRYEPQVVERDTAVKSALKEQGTEVKSFNSALLFEPWDVLTKQETPYKVFTPYWKACCSRPQPPQPFDAPKKISPPKKSPESLRIDDLNLLPAIDWAGGLRANWQPGEAGALGQLNRFANDAREYPTNRDLPFVEGTSRLSPHLHFGEISPRRVWHELLSHKTKTNASGIDAYLRELGWREFAHQVLFHFPHTTQEPMRDEFTKFPWRSNPKALKQWQKGRTGYPIVDAGMRELWRTGWMHNRVRMIVASFLVKDLLVHWREGAEWFWDTLVDADLANNTMGWQWTAGCGADAAPYFRIFNPITQGEKFDPDGEYVRRWVPELKSVPKKWIHKPWLAPQAVLQQSGVTLGNEYPLPIIDHSEARELALESYKQVKQDSKA